VFSIHEIEMKRKTFWDTWHRGNMGYRSVQHLLTVSKAKKEHTLLVEIMHNHGTSCS
jgi:hypothetical protein